MGLEKSFYTRTIKSVEEGGLDYCAATEKCPWRGGVLQGQVHDDNCWAMGGYGGHAGVFAPVGDVLRFTAALFGGFLSYDTLKTMWSPVMGGRTYGWDVPSGDEPSVGKVFGLPRYRAVGHLGFTGTSLWVLPKNGLAIALLSNRVHPSRDNILIKSFRSQVHEALAEDLDFKTQ
jgi:CubicO group peptidase (beta-lactamase class C family)